jgi:HAD superfamily hydrolase (TIGR01509 family)
MFSNRNSILELAIGSSSKNARFILEKLSLGDYFDGLSDGNNISESKPDPEVFLKAAYSIGLKPSECLVVEDAKAGVEAAFRGGFHCAGIGEAALDSKITYPLRMFSELKQICEKE